MPAKAPVPYCTAWVPMLILASANGTMWPSKKAYSSIERVHATPPSCVDRGRIIARASMAPNSHGRDWHQRIAGSHRPLTGLVAPSTVLCQLTAAPEGREEPGGRRRCASPTPRRVRTSRATARTPGASVASWRRGASSESRGRAGAEPSALWLGWIRAQPLLAVALLGFCVVAGVGLLMSLPAGLLPAGRTGSSGPGARRSRRPAVPWESARVAHPERRPPASEPPPQPGPWIEEGAVARPRRAASPSSIAIASFRRAASRATTGSSRCAGPARCWTPSTW